MISYADWLPQPAFTSSEKSAIGSHVKDCTFSVCGVTDSGEKKDRKKKSKLYMNSGLCEDKDLSLTMTHSLK